jgi:FAD/FMN-containing dehydrogenase
MFLFCIQRTPLLFYSKNFRYISKEIKTKGRTKMLDSKKTEEFKSILRGQLVQPSDSNYEEACKVYNGMIHKKPRMIAYCNDVADVIAAVNFGRDNNLLVAIRGGGHNGGGLGTCDDGLVIDLSKINYTRIDPKTKTIRVGGGCKWGDVDHVTHEFGMATPSGIVSTTGVGGLTLGGGLGHLTRKCGLTIDNLLEADMVLASGEFVTVNSKENEELFWAIRGGGGNFGIITSFLFKLHSVYNIIGGPTFWDLDMAAEAMRFYDNFMKTAPDDISGFFAYLIVPPAPPFPEELHMKNVCGVVWCYTGPKDKAEKVFAPIKNFGPPLMYGIMEMPHPALQSAFDGLYPPGMQWYWKADFVSELSDAAIKEHVKYGSNIPTMFSGMHLYPIDGAASRVKSRDTAWSYRDARYAQVIVGVDPDPASTDMLKSWANAYFDALHPYSAGGAYVNFMMEEGEERVKATYRENYERLSTIKRKYDPDNFFRVNQNIKPVSVKMKTSL